VTTSATLYDAPGAVKAKAPRPAIGPTQTGRGGRADLEAARPFPEPAANRASTDQI